MKYKKYSYIIVMIMMLLVGINNVNAAAQNEKYCYYMTNDGNYKTSLKIKWGYRNPGMHGQDGYTDTYIDKFGQDNYMNKERKIKNWFNNSNIGDVYFAEYYKNSKEANKFNNGNCPQYLVIKHCNKNQYKVWATENDSIAIKAVQEIEKNSKCTGVYVSNKNASGGALTSEEYYSEFIAEGLVTIDPNGEVSCDDYESIFGDPKDDGKNYDPDGDEQKSIRNMINEMLQYVRIIVPILIILLGVIDFSKAVLAAKEDNMKKAQTDFIKRLVIGVAVFFVPLLVDVVMWLADIVWGQSYPHCGL